MTFYIFFFCVSLGLLCCCCCWFEGRRGGRVKNDSNKLRVFLKLRTLNKTGRKGGSNKAIKNTFSETLNKSSKCWKLLSVSAAAIRFTFAFVGI